MGVSELDGVCVGVTVEVLVGVCVGVNEGVEVTVPVIVDVGVGEDVLVFVMVWVGVLVGVLVIVGVGVCVGQATSMLAIKTNPVAISSFTPMVIDELSFFKNRVYNGGNEESRPISSLHVHLPTPSLLYR